jgi:excisionase family DNA binding protein
MSIARPGIPEQVLISQLIETNVQLTESIEGLKSLLVEIRERGVPMTVPTSLDKKQAAEYLRVAPETLDNWVSRRTIPYRKAGGRVYFELDELRVWTRPKPRK